MVNTSCIKYALIFTKLQVFPKTAKISGNYVAAIFAQGRGVFGLPSVGFNSKLMLILSFITPNIV